MNLGFPYNAGDDRPGAEHLPLVNLRFDNNDSDSSSLGLVTSEGSNFSINTQSYNSEYDVEREMAEYDYRLDNRGNGYFRYKYERHKSTGGISIKEKGLKRYNYSGNLFSEETNNKYDYGNYSKTSLRQRYLREIDQEDEKQRRRKRYTLIDRQKVYVERLVERLRPTSTISITSVRSVDIRIQGLESRIYELESESNQKYIRLVELMQEQNELREQISNIKQQYNDENRAWRNSNLQLRLDINKLQFINDSLKIENQQLRLCLQKQNEFENRLDKISLEQDKLCEDFLSVNEKNAELEKKLNDASLIEFNKVKRTIGLQIEPKEKLEAYKKDKKIEKLKKQINAQNFELSCLRTDKEQHTKKIFNLRNECDNLRQHLTDIYAEINNLNSEHDELSTNGLKDDFEASLQSIDSISDYSEEHHCVDNESRSNNDFSTEVQSKCVQESVHDPTTNVLQLIGQLCVALDDIKSDYRSSTMTAATPFEEKYKKLEKQYIQKLEESNRLLRMKQRRLHEESITKIPIDEQVMENNEPSTSEEEGLEFTYKQKNMHKMSIVTPNDERFKKLEAKIAQLEESNRLLLMNHEKSIRSTPIHDKLMKEREKQVIEKNETNTSEKNGFISEEKTKPKMTTTITSEERSRKLESQYNQQMAELEESDRLFQIKRKKLEECMSRTPIYDKIMKEKEKELMKKNELSTLKQGVSGFNRKEKDKTFIKDHTKFDSDDLDEFVLPLENRFLKGLYSREQTNTENTQAYRRNENIVDDCSKFDSQKKDYLYEQTQIFSIENRSLNCIYISENENTENGQLRRIKKTNKEDSLQFDSNEEHKHQTNISQAETKKLNNGKSSSTRQL